MYPVGGSKVARAISKSNVRTIILTAIGVAVGAAITPLVLRLFSRVPGI